MYIYVLPYETNLNLCRRLDNDDGWRELAGWMGYSPLKIQEINTLSIRQNKSPSEILLKNWGHLNHTVQELFILLHRMKHISAMQSLIDHVDERYHKLLEKDQKSVVTQESSDASVPVFVKRMEQGRQIESTWPKGFEGGNERSTSMVDSSSGTSETEELMRGVSTIPTIPYEELQQATDNWNLNRLLGKGGFGQVFKGEWKCTPVAVKRLKHSELRNRELIKEMTLNQFRHDNILPLYGYCLEGSEACLVYQLMAGGSLEQRLRGRSQHPPLSWHQRLVIAHGIARGLQYLHSFSQPLIHGDIKPANILLDQCSEPKIGDFGLARRGPNGEGCKVTGGAGTRAYLPEEFLKNGFLSIALDVYSYGVLIAEVATRLIVVDKNRPGEDLCVYIRMFRANNYDFASLEDPVLKEASNPELCREFLDIAFHCMSAEWKERPKMHDVYTRLNNRLNTMNSRPHTS